MAVSISTQLAALAAERNMRLIGRMNGVCWDNAQQESFWSTLKTGYHPRYRIDTHEHTITAVSSWIETAYNRRRRHSALGQISLVAFEHRLITKADKVPFSPMSTQRGSTPKMAHNAKFRG